MSLCEQHHPLYQSFPADRSQVASSAAFESQTGLFCSSTFLPKYEHAYIWSFTFFVVVGLSAESWFPNHTKTFGFDETICTLSSIILESVDGFLICIFGGNTPILSGSAFIFIDVIVSVSFKFCV